MGILARIQEWIEKRKLKQKSRQLEDRTTKEVREFLDKFEALENIEDDSRRVEEQKILIKQFADKVEDGQINLGREESDRKKDAILIVENYFKDNPKISNIAENIRMENLARPVVQAVRRELLRMPPELEKIEKIAQDYLDELQKDQRIQDKLKVYSKKEKRDIILELMEKYISDPVFFAELKHKLTAEYGYSFARDIASCRDNMEKQRIYEEYVRDFLGGKEDPNDYIVNHFKDEQFILCRKYGMPNSERNIVAFYEATEDKEEDVQNRNRKLAAKKLNQDVKSSDLVLVRTTNEFPRHGIVETQDKHSTPLMDGSFFDKEIKEAGLDLEDYKMAAFRCRRSVHWTLNGLVGSHAYGNFDNRRYIIIEPFEEQENHNGLLNIRESDTYFEDDVKLSPRATILMPVEKYKEECKDLKRKEELSRYNIALFVGDEELAVEMLLHDRGYVSGKITANGFAAHEKTPEGQYAHKMKEKMKAIAESKNGRVEYGASHYYSESRKQDGKRASQLFNERMDNFLNYLFENSGVHFSIPYLKAFFRARKANWGRDDTYEDYLENVEEDPSIKRMTPKEVFEAIGPEKMKELTQGYNEMVFEEHRRARAEKDKQLVEKGLITPEEMCIGTQENR